MPPSISKKRKVLDGLKGKTGRPKKFRKQAQYHSSDEDEEQADFPAVSLADSDQEEDGGVAVKASTAARPSKKKHAKSAPAPQQQSDESSSDGAEEEEEEEDAGVEDDEASGEDDSSGSETLATGANRKSVSKRNDPTAFSTSISKILSTKLPTAARADPVLSRSRNAAQTSSDLANEKLDQQARAKLRADKKEELDRGRVRDVMGIERGMTGAVTEEEKRLRKMAQRGVVKLFNAVRAAQVRGEEAAKDERQKGTVGMGEREKAVNEVSKQGFLDLINGKKGKPLNIEEA
ncbi:hypothetical protein N7510_004882 [Penicillium lagena]|uniref:uncharacterized protein n=1 Tax=Penicillium lagena TaxID=94218 RepID=UPI002541EFDF|nr:uncharacterized protein N7510_004882 [Penicillium lagena]KAJ5620898.1 hypothetical protein N7510_004882 [Penicillium lagena]